MMEKWVKVGKKDLEYQKPGVYFWKNYLSYEN